MQWYLLGYSDCHTSFLWANDNSRGNRLVSWSDPQDCNRTGFAGRTAHLAKDERKDARLLFGQPEM